MVKRLRDKPIVLKLGGSVITHKDKVSTPNLKAIERLAGEISQSNIKSLILVHGGGSFGHPVAKKYSIHEGYNDPSQIPGFYKTQKAMIELNLLVMKSLIKHNINAAIIQSSSCMMTKSDRIQNLEIKPLRKMIELGIIPVLYGDAVFDSIKGFTILSGDQLVSSLAQEFNASRIIIGTDVDGLRTEAPAINPSANLIKRTTLIELKTNKYGINGSKTIDVTGGMKRKMTELIPAIESDIPAMIVNAKEPLRLYKALKGEEVIGTIIEKG